MNAKINGKGSKYGTTALITIKETMELAVVFFVAGT
jgi:hypothetical protein